MKSKEKGVVGKIVNIFLWIFLIFAIVMTIFAFSAQASSTGFPKINDKCLLMVESDSMAESTGFYKGDLIISRVIEKEEEQTSLNKGDVISFYVDLTPDDGLDNKEINTHRIVDIITNDNGLIFYQTKGDHNLINDDYLVPYFDVQAVWTGKRIPKVGGLLSFLQAPKGFLICIVIPLFIFFLYELIRVFKTVMELKNKNKGISKEEEELIKKRAVEEYLKKQQENEE